MNNTETLEWLQDRINELRNNSQGKVIQYVYVAMRNGKFEFRAGFDDTTEVCVEDKK